MRNAHEPGQHCRYPANLRPCRDRSRRRHAARRRGLQTDRHHDLHWLQSLRSRLRGMERSSIPRTTFDNTYQTMPETRVELLEPDQVQRAPARDGTSMWLMRKDQCMHCADPGCLRACPADGAIVQYANGIVDFQQDNCIGCGYCITGCPSTFPSSTRKPKRFSSARSAPTASAQGLEPACIKACPTGCLHFGTKDDMTRAGRIPAPSSCGSTRISPTRASTILTASAAPASCMSCTT